MLTVTLYIVTGLTLYAGGHHLFLAGNRAKRTPNLQIGLLYLLLAGFALASALAYQPPSPDSLIPAGKMAIGLGIMLWLALVWFIAFRTAYKPALLLDLLTAVWLIFLINNFSAPGSLLYNAPTMSNLQASISPWWTAVEITMLASLAFCAYATFRLFRSGEKALAKVLMGGLALLRQKLDLEREVEALRERYDREAVVYLGGSDDVDLVVDMRPLVGGLGTRGVEPAVYRTDN